MALRDPWRTLFKHVMWIGLIRSLCVLGATSEVTLRLADGSDESNGRVEVFYEGAWGTVCDDGFDRVEGDLICRLLGYKDLLGYFHYLVYGEGSGQIWEAPNCQSTSTDFTDCFTLAPISSRCDHRDDVGLSCGNGTLMDVSFRLTSGPSALAGRVELFYDGAWGTLCDSYINKPTADFICRALGYERALFYYKDAQHGEGTGYIWLGVSCPNRATTFTQCVANRMGFRCSHRDDAGVECGTGTINYVSFRLVNGTDESNGLIEVYHYGAWGTICASGRDGLTAHFICRSLGYEYSLGISTYVDGGQEAGYIWRGVSCPSLTTQNFSECVADNAVYPGSCDPNARLAVQCVNVKYTQS